jgi:S-adenosylmethionine:tRNA ribosyltransferase-isomerase
VKTALFDYHLPQELIAQRPPAERDGGRLLVLSARDTEHATVRQLPDLLPAGALVVLNDSRVIKARLLGTRRPSGGRAELFLLRKLSGSGNRERWSALGRTSKPLRPGSALELGGLSAEVVERSDDGELVVELCAQQEVSEALEQLGRVPLPPYVRRADEPSDAERYQTLYANRPGSIAAPTAGLHLSRALLDRIGARGIEVASLSLHVGLGTFRPVTSQDLDQHAMHSEPLELSTELAARVAAARERGAPVVAIGTTVVRALESAADPDRPGRIRPHVGETRLLIQPGFSFRIVDALLTNFHMPKSTLLALVSAFAGRERVLSAYRDAVRRGYRFLSYGDAMWIPERGS